MKPSATAGRAEEPILASAVLQYADPDQSVPSGGAIKEAVMASKDKGGAKDKKKPATKSVKEKRAEKKAKKGK